MKKIELLAPAGNIDSFYAAINGGADAVYLGGKNFGARALASNFSDEEIIEAIKYAHLYNKKVYITVNTLIYENEINRLIKYVEFLHKNNVDALIIQDLGLINLLHKKFPNLELHASTQINSHNKETLKILKELGIKRVVLARETSLNEINQMNIDIEKEVFIHGALCMSYSGQCLLSSVIGGRSGNRGLCAGPCRLEYKLIEEDNSGNKKIINNNDTKYLLSTKDLCTLEYLEKILKSNVDSLKIEGRMKSKEYVYLVTSIYRKAIDNFYKTNRVNVSKKDIENLKLIFNRNFTKGFIFNEDKKNIENSYRPNHLGLEIGNVISQSGNRVKLRLSNKLKLGDGIRILQNKDYGFTVTQIIKNQKSVKEANKNDVVEIECNEKIKNNSLVVKTLDSKQIHDIDENIKKKIKIPINIKLEGRLNKKLILNISDGINNIIVYSELKTFKANKHPLTKERIIEQLSKLKDTPFEINKIKVDIDNDILIPIREINNLRRNAINRLIEKRIERPNNFKELQYKNSISNNKIKKEIINCFVKTEEQLLSCIKNNVDNIYVEEELYEKYKNKYQNLVLYLPRIIKDHKNLDNSKILIRELGSLSYSKNNEVITDYTLNVTNSYSIDLLNKNNVKRITLSTELNDELIKEIVTNTSSNNLELIIYGNIEIFITKHCILNKNINMNKICNICKNKNNYYLLDRKDEKYQIITDKLCNNILLSSKKINLIDKIDYYRKLGIKSYRLQFYNETEKEVNNILSCFKKQCI